MTSALDWIDQAAQWLGRFVPRWEVLAENQGAVKFVRGRARILQGPRILWHWPIITSCYTYWTAEQVVTLAPQMLTTQDRQTVAVQAVLTFQVEDLHKFGVEVFEAEESVAEAAGEAVRHVVIGTPFAELQAGRAGVDNALQKAAEKACGRFGVKILKMRLTSLAQVRVLGHFALNLAADRAQGGRAV